MDSSTLRNLASKLNLASVGKPAVAGAIALVVMVAVVASRLVIDAATANVFEIEPAREQVVQSSDSEQAISEDKVCVHVAGCVVAPGVVTLDQGARVGDAVNMAGGFAEGAAVDAVNLARVVQDGEQILIPSKNEGSPENPEMQGTSLDQNSQQGGGSGSGLVNINTAGSSELQALPGIGPSTAAKIIDDRKANGSFKNREDLKRVPGIGDKKYEALADLICV